MSTESTQTVRHTDAIQMLRYKGIQVYDDDCNDRLADMLYDNRESEFEYYFVVDDDYVCDQYESFKTWW